MKRKMIFGILTACVLSAAFTLVSFAATERPGLHWDFRKGGKMTCVNDDGKLMKGWLNINGRLYYADKDGVIKTNTEEIIDGIPCKIDKSGVVTSKDNIKLPVGKKYESSKSETEQNLTKMAEKVLSKIIKDDMNDQQKCEAVYNWMHQNIAYIDTSVKDDWAETAFNGFRSKSGDCFTYYGISRAMFDYLGLDIIEVIRDDGHHWWCLINIDGSWYHLDTTPRTKGGNLCLLTDDEIDEYSRIHSSNPAAYTTHGFDHSIYPKTPKESLHK